MYVKDHNGNKCVHFLCYPNIEMYLYIMHMCTMFYILYLKNKHMQSNDAYLVGVVIFSPLLHMTDSDAEELA